MPEFDLFDFFRFLLMVAVSVYCIATTIWWIVSWVRMDIEERYRSILWKYLLVQLLRTRMSELWRPLAEIAALLVLIGLLFWVNTKVIHG